MEPKITVYVKSMKVQVGETLVEELYPIKRPSIYKDIWFKTKIKKIYNYVLPEDQKALVEVVEQLSEQRGLELRIIDVTKEMVIYRFWRKLKGIKNFPIVETSRGERLQAPFSQVELERFISSQMR